MDEPVYQFMDKKRAEGKHYLVYMMASANKFAHLLRKGEVLFELARGRLNPNPTLYSYPLFFRDAELLVLLYSFF